MVVAPNKIGRSRKSGFQLVVGKELEVAVLSLSNFLDQSSVVDFATRVQVPIRQAIDDNVENKICPFCLT